ncbi:MAG: hypothetical protein LW815_09950 [Chitinophagaceae bacterium]|nr:hypothetical protein [Chitinophagaceae bacterium]
MIITNNKVVSINYMLKDELGNLLQGNDGFTQEDYLQGQTIFYLDWSVHWRA